MKDMRDMVGDLYGDEARSSVNAGRRLGRSAACAVAIEAQHAWVYAAACNRNAASSRGKRIVKGAGVILVPCCLVAKRKKDPDEEDSGDHGW
jgi:hypothetical protein